MWVFLSVFACVDEYVCVHGCVWMCSVSFRRTQKVIEALPLHGNHSHGAYIFNHNHLCWIHDSFQCLAENMDPQFF